MKYRFFLSIICLLPIILYGQNEAGIRFANELTWNEVKTKAKEERKFIFLDLYATWCGPCKQMDRDTYLNDTVGKLVNKHFISVKVQMDSTKDDSKYVKMWFASMSEMKKKYAVSYFPTFLFLDADGNLLYSDIGYKNPSGFNQLVKDALNPVIQDLFGKLQNYKIGNADPDSLRSLAQKAKKIGMDDIARTIARDYLSSVDLNSVKVTPELIVFAQSVAQDKKQANLLFNRYKTDSLRTETQVLRKDNLSLLMSFLSSIEPNDFVYRLLSSNPGEFDSVSQRTTWSRGILPFLIKKHELSLALLNNDKPVQQRVNWDDWVTKLAAKYPSIDAGKIVVDYKTQYYRTIKDWENYSNAIVNKVEKYWTNGTTSSDAIFDLNSNAWEVFLYSSSYEHTVTALAWINAVLAICDSCPQRWHYLDTKANILYKMGDLSSAISIEKEALKVMRREDPELLEALEKMKAGQPTWKIGLDQKKKIIDTLAVRSWIGVTNDASISNDGAYMYYKVTDRKIQPLVSYTLLKSTSSAWEYCINGIGETFFSVNSQKFVSRSADKVVIVDLNSKESTTILNVSSFARAGADNSEWIFYQLKESPQVLVGLDLINGSHVEFSDVKDLRVSPDGKTLAIGFKKKKENLFIDSLATFDLTTQESYPIVTGNSRMRLSSYAFNKIGNVLSFLIRENETGKETNSFWIYEIITKKIRRLVDDSSVSTSNKFKLSNYLGSFDTNENWSYFIAEREKLPTPNIPIAKLDVWNHKDKILQTVQSVYIGVSGRNLMAASNSSRSIIEIQNDDQGAILYDRFRRPLKGYVIVYDNPRNPQTDNSEQWQFQSTPRNYFLLKLDDGTKKFLTNATRPPFWFSPNGNYIVYYDKDRKNYFSYEVANGKSSNITGLIKHPLGLLSGDKGDNVSPLPIGIAGWINEEEVLLYDNFDIWQVDVSNKRTPKNLTNGYGRKESIQFRIIADDGNVINMLRGDTLILTAFQTTSKFNGFARIQMNSIRNPEIFSMGSHKYFQGYTQRTYSGDHQIFNEAFQPRKAKISQTWLVQRIETDKAPNYFVTTDFQKFDMMSNFQPQAGYNWLGTELASWKDADGTLYQGILYKPEDFDTHKKYPVIIHIYDKMSDGMFGFPRPDLSRAAINIPWFVSRGYLVFTPDIHYVIGEPGRSAYRTVISSISYLSKKKYVDLGRLGMQGHSFGGFETVFTLTRTDKLAAAVEAAGSTNATIGYGRIRKLFGVSGNYLYDNSQYRIQSTLWQRPDLYLDNSPILKADNIKTPLLIMHNQGDPNVSFDDGIALFTALRRMQKPSWLLQYDGADHAIDDDVSALDYTHRLTQFFDHYLKNAPVPLWMSKGIPLSLKGIITGYDFDPAGNCGKVCKVCKMWNEKMKKDPVETMKEIREKTKSENWMGGGK